MRRTVYLLPCPTCGEDVVIEVEISGAFERALGYEPPQEPEVTAYVPRLCPHGHTLGIGDRARMAEMAEAQITRELREQYDDQQAATFRAVRRMGGGRV